jgi:phosphatidylserine/phosphatidylglycerophosphate/cardiolipin synthase-like enzyme
MTFGQSAGVAVSIAVITAVYAVACSAPVTHPEAAPTPYPETAAIGVATYFARDAEHPEQIVVQDVNSAQSEIVTAMYSFTYKPIWDAYVAAVKRGVAVTLLTDQTELRGNAAQTSGVASLCALGVKVRENVPKGRALEHLKLSVIDKRIGLVGSFNYTVSAVLTNDEILIRVASPLYAADWRTHILKMYSDSTYSRDACSLVSPSTPTATDNASDGGE